MIVTHGRSDGQKLLCLGVLKARQDASLIGARCGSSCKQFFIKGWQDVPRLRAIAHAFV